MTTLEKIKKDSQINGIELFKRFFDEKLEGINLIMKTICGFTLTTDQAKLFTEAIVNRYNKGTVNNFEDWKNGVGQKFTNDKMIYILSQNCLPVQNPPATAFNDLYKWTMMPVIRDMEKRKTSSIEQNLIMVTFKVDLRDPKMNEQIKTTRKLREKIFENLNTLKNRTFRTYHECLRVAAKDKDPFNTMLNGWLPDQATAETKYLVGGKVLYNNKATYDNNALTLKQINQWRHINSESSLFNGVLDSNEVNINFFKSHKDGEYYIEATGPWHKVTWLETSMMQTVYETVLRYNLNLNNVPYIIWLGDALLRCAMSISSVKNSNFDGLTGALFTGRRTGGFLFLVLQNYMYHLNFEQFAPNRTPSTGMKLSLGSSSCDSILILDKLGLRKTTNPTMPAGTHAHELSMVISALYPELDIVRPATTQIIGHYLYYKLSMHSNGTLLPGPVPALPDTIGTNVFLNAAKSINIIDNTEEKGKFFDLITTFRQDSGEMEDFPKKIQKCQYSEGIMASEIENLESVNDALQYEYTTFGAGGFFGDSAKVWTHPKAHSNSMAAKAIRVLTSDNNYSLLLKDNPKIKYIISDIAFDSQCPDFDIAKKKYIDSYEKNLEDFTKFPIKTGDNDYETCETSSKLALDKNASKLAQEFKIEIAKSAQKNYNTMLQTSCNVDPDMTLTFSDIDIKFLNASGGSRKTKKKHRYHNKQQSKKLKKRMSKRLKSKNKKLRRQSKKTQ